MEGWSMIILAVLTLGWAMNALGATSNPICATFNTDYTQYEIEV